MPRLEQFTDALSYYATQFHELGHATGHASRLKRDFGKQFGDDLYSKEELVAELTAAMICALIGIDVQLDNSAAYLKGWAERIKSDPRMFIVAAARAKNACNYILAIKESEESKDSEESE
jgi:antirestriction protein ArdC